MNGISARSTAAPRPAGSRKVLLLLLALFAMPIAIATALLGFGWRPASKPHGELIVSSQPLPFEGLRAANGTPLPTDLLAGHWTLLVAENGPCSDECQVRIDTVRRLHVALNKHMPRVRRVWLSPAPGSDVQLPALQARYPDLVVAAPASPAWQALLSESHSPLIVIDPAGRTVLKYGEPFDAKGALEDLQRLLRYSWLG
jgi:hypothetical protein